MSRSSLCSWRSSAIGVLIAATLGFAASVPVAFCLLNVWSPSEFWALTVPWIVGILAVATTFAISWSRRSQELRSAVSLQVDLLSPAESHYWDSFQLTYKNNGTRVLEAAVDLHVYPSTKGRNEYWNPAFRKDFRREIMSLGPFETHDLILGPQEEQDYPYVRFSALNACGLHGYTPHWLTLRISVWPRGMKHLVRTHTVHFYLLWFCGEESRLPGSWMIEPIRIRGRKHSNEESRERWRKQLAPVVPDEFLDKNLQNYIDLKCKSSNTPTRLS